jgi:tetratricopeptide (TPR) repeat protein
MNRKIISFSGVWFLFFSCAHRDFNPQEKEFLQTSLSLIQNHLDGGEAEIALQSLLQLDVKYKEDPGVRTMMAMSHLALSNPLKAKVILQDIHKEKPSPSSGLNLSSVLIELRDYSVARDVLKSYLENKDYPYQERIFHNMALSFEREGHVKNAYLYYKKALQEKPSYYPALYRLGILYWKNKKTALGIESLEKAVSYCSTCLAPIEALAQIYKEKKNKSGALGVISQFLKNPNISPKDQRRAQNLLY